MRVQKSVSDGDLVTAEVTVAAASHVQLGTKLSEVPVNANLPKPEAIEDELLEYVDVLLGRTPSPVASPYLSLAEVASAYYARAQELDMLIHMEERIGSVGRAHPLYKVRTGALRSFIELSKRMAELGSRRLTQEQLLTEMRHDSGI